MEGLNLEGVDLSQSGSLLQRVREQARKRAECRRDQPGLFAPAASPPQVFSPPQQQAGAPQTTGFTPATLRWWEEAQRKAVVQAREQGFEETRPGTWWCPFCEDEVDGYTLETHLHTNRHTRAMHHTLYAREITEKAARGDYPPYIEIRNQDLYCTLCYAFATENHMNSSKHQQRVTWWEREANGLFDDFEEVMHLAAGPSVPSLQGPTFNLCQPCASWNTTSMPSSYSGPLPIGYVLPSPAYGDDPGIYELRDGCLYCRVCCKNADESHVVSERHQRYSSDKEWCSQHLGRPSPSHAGGFGMAPPPPPPSGGYHPPQPGAAYHPPPPPPTPWATTASPAQQPTSYSAWGTTPPPPPPKPLPTMLALPGGKWEDETPPPTVAKAPPPPPPPPAPVPEAPKETTRPEWVVAWSSQYGREYFFNSVTGENVWQLPAHVDTFTANF